MTRLLLVALPLLVATQAGAAPQKSPAATPAAPAPAAARPVKLAAPGLQYVQLSNDLATFYSEHLAQQLTANGLQVITAREIQTLLGFERQKQLLNCADESTSCMAELANALGVDGLVTGSIGKIGTSYQANLKILSAKDASMLASHSGRVKGEEALLDELTRGAAVMARQTLQAMGRQPVNLKPAEAAAAPSLTPPAGASDTPSSTQASSEVETRASRPSRLWPYVAFGVGGASLVGGGLMYMGARSDAKKLQDGADGTEPLTGPEADALYDSGRKKEKLAALLGGVGVAGVVAGVVLMLTEKAPSETAPSISYLPGGGVSVGVAGAFR